MDEHVHKMTGGLREMTIPQPDDPDFTMEFRVRDGDLLNMGGREGVHDGLRQYGDSDARCDKRDGDCRARAFADDSGLQAMLLEFMEYAVVHPRRSFGLKRQERKNGQLLKGHRMLIVAFAPFAREQCDERIRGERQDGVVLRLEIRLERQAGDDELKIAIFEQLA